MVETSVMRTEPTTPFSLRHLPERLSRFMPLRRCRHDPPAHGTGYGASCCLYDAGTILYPSSRLTLASPTLVFLSRFRCNVTSLGREPAIRRTAATARRGSSRWTERAADRAHGVTRNTGRS